MPDPNCQPSFHAHPKNVHDKVYGVPLVPGDTIDAATDVYDSTSGYWEVSPCSGLVLQEGSSAVWIRRRPEPPGTIIVQRQRPPLPPI